MSSSECENIAKPVVAQALEETEIVSREFLVQAQKVLYHHKSIIGFYHS